MAFTIRQITDDDFDGYKMLRLEALLNHPTAFFADYDTETALTRDRWLERIHQQTGTIFVAKNDSGLVGMMGILGNVAPKRRHTGDIWGVYVRPQARGQGIVEALLEACIAWGKERGMSIVKLGVTSNNVAAVRCYLRCGLTVYGVEPAAIFWDGQSYDDLLMARRI
jgi:ribosomal protein S18 acetylase RimI-like enzyme